MVEDREGCGGKEQINRLEGPVGEDVPARGEESRREEERRRREE